MPKLESSFGQDQANAVLYVLCDWNIEDKVQVMCCDTTAFNTGRLNGPCVLLEQKLVRKLLLFACRHYETCTNIVTQYFCNTTIKDILKFHQKDLQKSIVHDDRELIELSVIFLGVDKENKIKIRPMRCIKQDGWL